MRERKYVTIPVQILDDPRISPSEVYLITQILRRQSEIDKVTVARLKPFLRLSENTVRYGLLKLTECGYLTRDSASGEWLVNISPDVTSEPQNLSLNTSKSEPQSLNICGNEREEERTKEEDKANNDSIVNYNYNTIMVKENDKEKEILKKEKDEGERFTEEYRQIIGYLNEKTGKNYSAKSRINQGHMSARLREGFTVDDFKKVIDVKCFQWKDDQKMAKFLRPETLFGTKFDRYLNEEKYVIREGLHGEKYMVTEEEMNSDIPF